MMDIEKMCRMQHELDERIVREKELNWTPEQRFKNTVVALDVELAEFANEGRWFKRWSQDQEPRNVLEEYVDGIHFFLSLANQKGWGRSLYLYTHPVKADPDALNNCYLLVKANLFQMLHPHHDFENLAGTVQENHFARAWQSYISIGVMGFGFKMEDIEQAYMDKNETNQQRQNNGY